jgi:SAM-dependent methyltransferase
MSLFSGKKIFKPPPQGSLEPHSRDDPLPYYYYPLISYLYRRRIEQGLALLTPPYDSILELGYGSGILLPTLASFGKTVSGIDIAAEPQKVMDHVKKIGADVFLVQGDIYDMAYPKESFDLVVAFSVFEHIFNVEQVINKVFLLLKPGGHFLVGMPRTDILMKIAFPLIGYYNIKEHHITNYRQFLRLAEKLFQLKRVVNLPSWAPRCLSLYFNMLFCKNENNGLQNAGRKFWHSRKKEAFHMVLIHVFSHLTSIFSAAISLDNSNQ